MSDPRPEHARRLVRAFESEVFGETLFSELARRRSDLGQTEVLLTLAALERHMGSALAALLDQLGVEVRDPAPSRDRGIEAAHALVHQSWSKFLSVFGVGTSHALVGYDRLRAASPEPDHPTLVLLTDHELALRDFAELAQTAGVDPLGPVRDVIERMRPIG